MNIPSRTFQELLKENAVLKKRIRELEISGAGHKQAEEALQASERRYQAIFETTGTTMLIVEEDMTISLANGGFESLTGYTREEIEGKKKWTEFVEKSDLEKMIARHQSRRVDSALTLKSYEFKLVHRDGHIRNILLTVDIIPGTRKSVASLLDITARKRAEEQLRDTETRYRMLFEHSPDGVVIIDSETERILEFNETAHRQLGYSREEFAGLSIFDLEVVETPEETRSRIAQVIREGRADFDTRQKTRQGEIRNVHVKAQFIEISGKQLYHCIWRDITDRKRAEEALRQSETKYRLITENMADVITVLDMNLRYTYVSPSIIRLRGFTAEEATEQTLDQAMKPESLKIALAAFEEEMKLETGGTADPNRIRTLELEEYRKDGSSVWVEVNLSFLRDKDLKPVAILAVSRDISERKRAEVEYMRLVTAIEQSAEGIYLTDTNWIIQYANSAFEKMLGYNKGEIIGWHAGLLKSGRHDRAYYRDIRETLVSGKVWSGRGINRKKDGTFIDANVTMSPVYDRSGDMINYVCIHRDITREIALEAQLARSEKLKSIGTLAGGIAHDFNNLLTGIQGYASLTMLDLDPSHPHYENMRQIEEQVRSGADLTRQLLGFARGGRYEVKSTDMNDIIRKTASMFGRAKKEIVIHQKYAETLWPVEVDRGQMEQVFMNLYVNAWQAMPGGGEIDLETENVFLDDEQASFREVKPGRYVKITVADKGTGMDAQTRERAFDPFFTTKEMGRGSGLGLATVYGIITGHKGMIDLDSEPGHGTTFRIYLPASERRAVRETKVSGTIARGSETILLVDDEKIVLTVTRELLKSLGYRVHEAGSGQEAAAIYNEKKDKIALVILDMIMPGISGGETYDRLKEINPNILVLLSSGYSFDEEAQAIMKRGCNGFLQKPFQVEDLSKKVREILDMTKGSGSKH